jgi:hypothetical protein
MLFDAKYRGRPLYDFVLLTAYTANSKRDNDSNEERECSADICIIHTCLSIECLWQYINNNSQARVEPSAAEKKEEKNRQQQPQKRQGGGVEQQQDVVDYHAMTASSSSRTAATAATTNNAAMGEQRSRNR